MDVANKAWYDRGEIPYVDEWFLMGSPLPVLGVLAAYLAFVLKVGPALMEKRPPFQLKSLLIIYNIAQVLLSFYIFQLGVQVIWKYGLVNKSCVLDEEIPQKIIIPGCYTYYIAKVTELLDTVFFVLRKKKNQITFLHVYHHSLMMISTWAMLKYDPTYQIVFLGTINSFVHVIMYSYYALSAFPSLEKYLWWKKYITSMQLIQFGLIMLQMMVSCYVSECPASVLMLWNIFINVVLMMYLFSDFYFKAYVKKDKDTTTKSKNVTKNEEICNGNTVRRNIKNKGE